jgi:RHS repeat-associated protein
MLARLTSAQTPEAGTTSYSYAVSGSPCSGSPSSPCSRTDARGITTTYSYDALNRLLGKTHSDSTPPADFLYDQAPASWPAWSGVSFSNAKGRLVLACTNTTAGTCTSPATAVAYSYDPVGRIANFWQCNPSNCGSSSIWNVKYNYDKAGDITSWVDPGGFTLTNTVNSAQQVTAVQSSWKYSPPYLVQSATYTPWGAVSQLENGCVGTGCTPAVETYTYNNRLQATGIQLGTTSNTSQYASLTYNYNLPGGTQPPGCPISPGTSGNNGNVIGYTYTDAVNSGFSHSALYVYDSLNRLACAQATGNSTYNVAFTYDRYGNMACSLNSYTNIGSCPEWTYNSSTNQLTTSGCTYDAAGNMTEDCSTSAGHTFQWDAEGRVSSVDPGKNPPTWTFTYNAVGNRVQWANPGGADQHMFDPWGNWLGVAGEYSVLWWGRTFLAAYEGSETYLNHLNGIGSTTMLTNQAGTPAEDMLFYPWGDVWQSWGTGGYNFANLPYDDVNNGISPSMFRLYSMGLGRWLSPDPLGGNPTNPQSLNRYAYALNGPTTLTDPLGLQNCPAGATQVNAGQCFGNALEITSLKYGWGFIGFGAWDEFGLMWLGNSEATTTYEYALEPSFYGIGTSDRLELGDMDSWMWSYSFLVDWTYEPTGVAISSPDPGIVFTLTGPTTATFVSQYTFWDTVGKFAGAGFRWDPLDPFHHGQLDMRDPQALCSAHIDIDKATGRAPGVPTTGQVHLDTVNPYGSIYSLALFGPGSLALTFLGHEVFDVIGGGLYPGSEACR